MVKYWNTLVWIGLSIKYGFPPSQQPASLIFNFIAFVLSKFKRPVWLLLATIAAMRMKRYNKLLRPRYV
jgi:hypothetical protein